MIINKNKINIVIIICFNNMLFYKNLIYFIQYTIIYTLFFIIIFLINIYKLLINQYFL
jgi:hypothetical protein